MVAKKPRNEELEIIARKIMKIVKESDLNQAEKLGILDSVKLSLFNDEVNENE